MPPAVRIEVVTDPTGASFTKVLVDGQQRWSAVAMNPLTSALQVLQLVVGGFLDLEEQKGPLVIESDPPVSLGKRT